MQEVLRLRKENFETHGDARQLVPGRSWAAWARAIGHLLPPLDVADIGCGEGYLTLEAARWARTVVGIDRSDEVLERAKALAARRRATNVEWKKGDLSRLPLRDAAGGRRAVITVAAPRQRSGARDCRSDARAPSPAAVCSSSTSASTTRPGSETGSGIVTLASPPRTLTTCCTAPDCRTYAFTSAPARPAIRSPC
jgi:SAM-dependent methyltransferase